MSPGTVSMRGPEDLIIIMIKDTVPGKNSDSIGRHDVRQRGLTGRLERGRRVGRKVEDG